MKNHKAKNRIMQAAVVMTAIACCSVAQAQRVNHNVEVELNDADTMLDVNTRGQCANGNHNGCIEVARGTQARFDFSFTGSKRCDLTNGRRWELGEVYLGGKDSPTKPTSWGGFQTDYQVQVDFNFADLATGQLIKESGSNRNSIIIFDNNNSPTAYDIWYKVTAVCVDRQGNILGTVETDPRIKNGGRQ